ncbi:hypothetical protein DSO57_1001835 [Entomophthora muscae]|uniref:Uncharacterized protein n=1 Tax=Entomophthora muscae TaxID=34485 RepID=A0ACC2SY42_9FUNG|nr:hypothetical protein DSO57_1001835 [Entomophthora muscae]
MSSDVATFAGGCFWGIEHFFKKQFGDAIKKSECGYTGGDDDLAVVDYQHVCSGETGHVEAVQFTFDPVRTTYKDLVTFFFRIHDPTTPDCQGNDRGSQYRSVIFYEDSDQKSIAKKVKKEVQENFDKPIVTEIVRASTWYRAEDFHQEYLKRNPNGYCNHYLRW